ncbi:HIT domain-containing protein [Litorivivens sp.]|uniref:HIT domain-containing protein n=1 Tax=Litorivivens sp. TaxID=2020868 RepID=UPI00356428CA
MFQLDERLAADTVVLGDLELCRVLLMNDAHYPWVILVPRRDNLREIYEMSDADQQQLQMESSCVAERMSALFNAEKMNIAALGNMVPQLHLHHIARFTDDAAWPKPVWGVVPAKPYSTDEMKERVAALQKALFD